MKTASLLILSILLTINLFAQPEPSEPINLNRNFLVNSAGLQEDFLLFTPDSAVQILFNPARANKFYTNFIYINYLSGLNTEFANPIRRNIISPTISAAALINTSGARWLFEFTNNINKGNELNSTGNHLFDIISSGLRYTVYDNSINSEYKYSGTNSSLKISRIFNTGKLNLSAGIYGMIYTGNYESKMSSYSELYNYKDELPYDTLKYRRQNIDIQNSTESEKASRYVLGVEFTVNNERMDYLGTLDFQFNDFSFQNNIYDENFHDDSTKYSYLSDWYAYSSENITNRISQKSLKPSVLNLRNYFSHIVNFITPDDNLFASFDLFYSWGKPSYEDKILNYYLYSSDQIQSGDTNTTINAGKNDLNDWGVYLSAGYSLTESFNDLYLLTGLRLEGNIEHLYNITNWGFQSNIFQEEVRKPSRFLFTLPLYLNYSATSWFSINGGINISYIYFHNNREAKYYAVESTLESNYFSENLSNTKLISQGWSSYKSVYLGCGLRHPSGLTAQLFFQNDLAEIRNWNISLGYHF